MDDRSLHRGVVIGLNSARAAVLGDPSRPLAAIEELIADTKEAMLRLYPADMRQMVEHDIFLLMPMMVAADLGMRP